MRTCTRRVAVLCAAVTALVMAVPAGAAVAASPPSSSRAADAAHAADQVQELVRINPGARRLTSTSAELKPGLIATALPDGPSTKTVGGVPTNCDHGYVCMYSNAQDIAHGGGFVLAAYNCGQFNLGNLAYPGGGWWNDKISAVYNNQTAGTNASWYNFDGSNHWGLVASQGSGHYLLDLATSGKSDIIDGVDVCDEVDFQFWSPKTPLSRWSGYTRGM
jgi:hypothetical protein